MNVPEKFKSSPEIFISTLPGIFQKEISGSPDVKEAMRKYSEMKDKIENLNQERLSITTLIPEENKKMDQFNLKYELEEIDEKELNKQRKKITDLKNKLDEFDAKNSFKAMDDALEIYRERLFGEIARTLEEYIKSVESKIEFLRESNKQNAIKMVEDLNAVSELNKILDYDESLSHSFRRQSFVKTVAAAIMAVELVFIDDMNNKEYSDKYFKLSRGY